MQYVLEVANGFARDADDRTAHLSQLLAIREVPLVLLLPKDRLAQPFDLSNGKRPAPFASSAAASSSRLPIVSSRH